MDNQIYTMFQAQSCLFRGGAATICLIRVRLAWAAITKLPANKGLQHCAEGQTCSYNSDDQENFTAFGRWVFLGYNLLVCHFFTPFRFSSDFMSLIYK